MTKKREAKVQGLKYKGGEDLRYLSPEHSKRLFKTHLQGSFVRSGASVFIWAFALVFYVCHTIDTESFMGLTACAVFLILMNVPLLPVLRGITRRSAYEYFSIFVNILEASGYTGVIYFLGGIRGGYMITLYACLITYVGVVAPRRYPFIVTAFCAFALSFVVGLEHFGVIPHQNNVFGYHYHWNNIVLMLAMAIASLFVVAFISAYTGSLLKRARDRLRRQNRELEISRSELSHAAMDLKEKNIQLEMAIDKARESERLKSQFLANMSHEIRTPLNAVLGFTDMLLDTELDGDQTDYARTVKRSGDALLSLINDILDLSKIEAGELDVEEIDFDPELLAFDVCELVRPRISSKPIEILCHIGDEVPSRVRGDPLRMRQVLTNLMANAAKFTESGEIELSLDVDEERDDRMKFHCTVRDTGIGIPGEKLDTIFNAFHQADGSTTRKFGGTGLGLTICKQISGLMDGDVCAESEVNRGSTFHFTGWFGRAEVKKTKRFNPISLFGKKALVVDDNQASLDILRHIMEGADMHVITLRRPQEVILTLQSALETEHAFAICVIDIQMPVMTGYEVAEEIRKCAYQFSNIPLIALSSSVERDAQRCKKAGFDGFMSKPIHREKLFQMLEILIGEGEGDASKREEVPRQEILTQYKTREEIKHSVGILLVEDNPVNQKLATLMLKKAGYNVVLAGDGEEAVEKYTEFHDDFDLIFMDVQMPRMDGLEATKEIRRREGSLASDGRMATHIPIVAMTAAAMKGDREKCFEAGMDDYVTKPIKRELVFKILEKWVFNRVAS